MVWKSCSLANSRLWQHQANRYKNPHPHCRLYSLQASDAATSICHLYTCVPYFMIFLDSISHNHDKLMTLEKIKIFLR